MDSFSVILLILSGLALLGVAVLLVLQFRKKDDGTVQAVSHLSQKLDTLQKTTADEFARNRMELAGSLHEMGNKLEAMTKANFEQRIVLTETVTKSMQDIRDRTVEQNEKQSKAVEAAILKMQESNEKKLDEMRMTVDEKLTSTLTTRLNTSFKTVYLFGRNERAVRRGDRQCRRAQSGADERKGTRHMGRSAVRGDS